MAKRVDAKRNGYERLPQTGAQGANASLIGKLRTVPMANDAIALGVEVPVFAPGQGRAIDMRASVLVGHQLCPLAHDDDGVAALVEGIKAARITVRQFVKAAKKNFAFIHS